MHTKVKRKLKHMARVSFYFLQTHWGYVFCTSPSMWRSNSYFQIYMCNEPKQTCNVNSYSILTGQLVPKTTRTQDNSYPRQLVPKTTRTQDNSYPRQLVPKTTRTQDNSYPCGMIWGLRFSLASTLCFWIMRFCRLRVFILNKPQLVCVTNLACQQACI